MIGISFKFFSKFFYNFFYVFLHKVSTSKNNGFSKIKNIYSNSHPKGHILISHLLLRVHAQPWLLKCIFISLLVLRDLIHFTLFSLLIQMFSLYLQMCIFVNGPFSFVHCIHISTLAHSMTYNAILPVISTVIPKNFRISTNLWWAATQWSWKWVSLIQSGHCYSGYTGCWFISRLNSKC